jgi:putative membrane protein
MNGISGCRFFSSGFYVMRWTMIAYNFDSSPKGHGNMKILFRIIGLAIFVLFFLIALKNTGEVSLRFFLNHEITAPLVLMLLGFFAAGAVFGVMAMTPMVMRSRREASRQKKTVVALQKENEVQLQVRTQPPPPDAF